MNIQREKEFVSQYHFDARNFEWEKENGTPCLTMLNRLTYEVTEIALDLPGINLEF